jgi:hypothetical protein
MADKTLVIKSGEEESVVTIRPKTFKTGSKGYFAFGKVTIDGKRYQLSGFVVEIGSRPEGKK